MPDKKNIKLYVAAHKQAYVPDAPFLVPVQAGAAIADERIDGFQPDDEGLNISQDNKLYRDLTVQYWAWKNEDADYFGFMQYRRYFEFARSAKESDEFGVVNHALADRHALAELGYTDEQVRAVVEANDIVVCEPYTVPQPKDGAVAAVRRWYDEDWRKNGADFDRLMGIIVSLFPEYRADVAWYLGQAEVYPFNLYIMNRAHFNEYAQFQFSCLKEFARCIDAETDAPFTVRAPEFLAGHLLGIYLAHCRRTNGSTRIAALRNACFDSADDPYLKPAFPERNCPVVFSSSDYYSVFMGVAIHSILENASDDWNYDIIVLDTGMRESTRMQLRRSIQGVSNVSLRFIKIERLITSRNLPSFEHISIGTFGRFLILDYLEGYDKIIYLDCDLVVDTDIAELYNTEIGDNLLAAVRDTAANGWYRIPGHEMKDHMDNVLQITENCGYFNAGVLVMNLSELRKVTTCEELLTMAVDPKWLWLDQDVLNHLCRGRVHYVDQAWNYMAHKESYDIPWSLPEVWLPGWLQKAYADAQLAPKIVHFAGHSIPCFVHAFEGDCYWYFWKYARTSMFYERVLKIMMSETVDYEQHSVTDHARHAAAGVKRAVLSKMRR